MPALKYKRKLAEVWVFDDLYVQDRLGNRQSLAGVADLRATFATFAGAVIWTNDHTGCSSTETSDPATAGNFTYTRSDLTGVVVGSYRLDFRATIDGVPVAIPEDSYIIVEVI